MLFFFWGGGGGLKEYLISTRDFCFHRLLWGRPQSSVHRGCPLCSPSPLPSDLYLQGKTPAGRNRDSSQRRGLPRGHEAHRARLAAVGGQSRPQFGRSRSSAAGEPIQCCIRCSASRLPFSFVPIEQYFTRYIVD